MSQPLELFVAQLAVRADGGTIIRGVAAVVTSEAAVRRHVAEIVRIGAPRHLHLGKDVPSVQRAGR